MRRRIAGLVLLLAVVLVGGKLFSASSHGPVPVEIHLALGQPPVATEVYADAGHGAATLSSRMIGPDGDVIWKARMPSGTQDLEITLVNAQAGRRTLHRSIEAQRNAVIRLDLSREAF